MDAALKSVHRRFVVIVLSVIVAVVSITWGALQLYSTQELDKPAKISEIHSTSKNNQAFAEYLEQQKAYEAHFLALATEIKQQEARRVTSALALTSAAVLLLGIGIAVFVARRLTKPVHEAYLAQERFIQDAAHELRNPLAAMTAALQQAPQEARKTPLLKTFARQTKRLIHINEDLLFLERRSPQKIERLNLGELLYDVIEELQPLAHKRNIAISAVSDDNIFKNMSATDYVRLAKNIVDNAIKYSQDEGKVTVTQQKLKHMAVLTVHDKGIGIPKKDVQDVGERFFRASNTGTIDGTGLGLAIVKKILNTYGGSMEISSTPKQGTTVIIRFPL